MRTHILGMALITATLASPAWSFGEVGRWSSGWAQGTSEYTVVDAKKNQLYIACNDTEPATMTMTVGGRDYTYGQGERTDFVLFIDGKGPFHASNASFRAGGDHFRAAWSAIRKAKTLQARTGDGKVVNLPLTGAAKALPAIGSKDFSCVTM